MTDYKLLDGINEPIEKVREFAQAKNERTVLMRRIAYLDSLTKDNSTLANSIWTTLDGESIPIADLEDSHLKNIIPHLNSRGVYNHRIQKEYLKRFGELPALLARRVFEDYADD